jgi:hypothetical protein
VAAQDGQTVISAPATLTVLPVSGTRFHDETFLDADWTTTTLAAGMGGSALAAQILADGNPGAYRSLTLMINAAQPGSASTFTSFSWKTTAVYDPSTAGAIASLDYVRDERLFSGGGQGQGTAIAVRQAGSVYLAAHQILPNTTWEHRATNGLTATDFALATSDQAAPPAKPDFSASVSPLEFGFSRSNSTSIGGPAYSTRAGIDNWSVTLHH